MRTRAPLEQRSVLPAVIRCTLQVKKDVKACTGARDFLVTGHSKSEVRRLSVRTRGKNTITAR